jgi:hypothetical protein
MKNNIVLLALLLGVFAFANTNEVNNVQTNSLENGRYRYMQPLKFVERGVEFFIFPNGEFDFNTHPRYRRSRGHGAHINISYGAPRAYRSNYLGNRSVRIEHDHLGRVRRVGNVFINYDVHGRIKRIGSVYMNYHNRMLANIGGLHIFYSRNGRIYKTTGSIKDNMGCHYCGMNNCNADHYNGYNDYYNHDNDYDDHGGYDDNQNYYRSKKAKESKRNKK